MGRGHLGDLGARPQPHSDLTQSAMQLKAFSPLQMMVEELAAQPRNVSQGILHGKIQQIGGWERGRATLQKSSKKDAVAKS